MFEDRTPKRTELSSLGEFPLIDRLTQGIPTYQKSTVKGIGDDAAILQWQKIFILICLMCLLNIWVTKQLWSIFRIWRL